MYFWTVRLATTMPSLSSSPQMGLAPHNRLSIAIVLMRAIVSEPMGDSRGGGLDLRCQYKRNPWRCQSSNVSGLTTNKAFFHWRTLLAKITSKQRSLCVNAGHFT